jgi:hypothetical protein
MPILYNVGNKLTAGSEPPQLYRYQDRVLGDGGTLETRDEASTFIRRLRSAGVLGSTVIAGVAGGVKAGTLYSIIGPDLDVTRGTVKNRVNRAGVLSEVASGVPATDFAGGVLRGTTVEPSAVNQIRNNTMQGAVVGVVGSGGSRPTNWAAVNPAGLSEEIVSSTVIDGIELLTVRFFGTANANALRTIYFDSQTGITASNGQTWTNSVYLSYNDTTALPVNARLVMTERTVDGSFVKLVELNANVTSELVRFSQSRTLDGGGTVERVQVGVGFNVTSGNSYDFTVRIGLPQMELGSVATSVIKTTGSAQTRNADVITKTGLGSVLPQTEGWVYAEVDVRNLGTTANPRRAFSLEGSTDTNSAMLNVTTAGVLETIFGGVTRSVGTTSANNGLQKWCIVYYNGGFKTFRNGILVDTYVGTWTNPSWDRFAVGHSVTRASREFNDPIHSYAIGSGSITDAQAIQLTTL